MRENFDVFCLGFKKCIYLGFGKGEKRKNTRKKKDMTLITQLFPKRLKISILPKAFLEVLPPSLSIARFCAAGSLSPLASSTTARAPLREEKDLFSFFEEEEEDVMGQTCSTPGEKEARDEDEEEEKVLEDDDDFGGCSAKRWCSSPLDVGKDFLRFEKSSVEEEERRDGRERGTKEVREERAPFFYREGKEEDARRDEEARVVGKVVSVVLSEEEKKSSPRYRWAVGDKELREAMTNGENTVKSTMFTAKKHEFRLSLGNSVVVEGGPAKTFVSAKLECCAPSSSSKLSRVSNFVDIAATMRVSLEFSGDVEISNDDNKRSIVLREAHTRQVLKTDQSECLVLRNFFKCDTAENNTTKHSTRNKTTTETKNIFQLVCEVEFNSVEAVKRTNDNEEDINTFNDTAVVAYCVSLSPLLFVFENFLQKKECKFLRELAEKDLKRSRVTDGKLSNGRTSSSCFLTGAKGKEEVVKTIERRMLNAIRKTPVLTKRRFDTQNLKGSEPMQIVRYGKNEKYTNHFDNKAGSFRRVATFMCYLSDQCEGGCTNFQKAIPLFDEPSFCEYGMFKPFEKKNTTFVASCEQQNGVKIHPKLGRAILFFSISEEPFRENPLSLHEGQIVKKGEKFICTKWLTRTVESDDDEVDFVSSDEADAD